MTSRFAPHQRPTLACYLLLGLVFAALGLQASAQSPDAASANDLARPLPSVEQVEQRIQSIAQSELAEAERNKLSDELNNVLQDMAEAQRMTAAAADFARAIETAPQEAERIREALADADAADAAPPAPDLPADADAAAVEARIAAVQAEIASIGTRLAKLGETLDAADQEPARLRERIAGVDTALRELEGPVAEADGLSEPAREARTWLRQARLAKLRAEQQMLTQQLLSTDARRVLALAQREQAEAELERAKALRAALEARAKDLRRRAAAAVQESIDAERIATAGAHPLVQAAVEQNAALAAAIAGTTEALDKLDDRRVDTERQVRRIDEEFANARKRLEAAGLNRAQGQVLIDQRQRLPDLRRLRRQAAARADQIADSTLKSIRWREELRRLDDLDAWVEQQLANLPAAAIDTAGRAELAEELRAQATPRRSLLRRALEIEDSFRRDLGEVDFAAQQLRDVVDRYDRYLSERLLWVRSIGPLVQQSMAPLPRALWWVVAPGNWQQVGATLLAEAPGAPLFWVALLAVVLLLWRSAPLKRAIRARAEPLRRVSTDGFRHTAAALGMTALAALPWPLLLAAVGALLGGSLAADPFSKAMGDAMVAVAPALYYLLGFRALAMRGGVADRHFRWHTDTLLMVRRSTFAAVTLLLPVGFVAAAVHQHQEPEFTGTLGRLSLALFELGLAVLTAVVLHPTRGALKHSIAERPDGWLARLRFIWYPAMIAVPLALAGFALSGFLYTSGVLLRSLINELWFALGLIIVHQLIVRWLIVTRRRLALQAALERRAQREAAKAADGAGAGADVLAVPDEGVDLASLDAQSRKLLNLAIFVAAVVGLWLIWSEVLPALNLLERVKLWSYTGTIDGVEQAIPVTLADLGIVFVIIAAAVAAGRNLPALLEILLLQNSHVSAGSRYTIITLTGYVITAIGALMVFGALGLSWGQVQWLVAALGVGIGFGLQEIVANFISGLIILFERPVRVGDIVSIGDTTGVVTKIQIRATTVRNWDRQELLVPNKEFITGRLLNWTLTDQTNRIVITVGVEYGSDTKRALKLLGDAARENEHVLEDPAPIISFEGFGNDALTLVLRCYLPNMDNRIDTTTALHQAINDKFQAAGIGIAFPQRDLHIRSVQPLEVQLRRAASHAGDDAPAAEP
ncbi:mechanosensitive ion channel domain-containing protein [Thiohalocapsa sp. ML1]|uniref:mechanosensitive ion channel domain-containing protein n=1 Tax=Thiohalocapsa sp. ML1 TaxID=1431688 RepID=UPI00073241C5|nr:mechanosensitive ion channel domain-containing protein [Thiohalocapsa sp. ML1]